MKQSIKIATAMYSDYKVPNGQVNFSDNSLARAVISTYKATETAAVTDWKKTENFFVDKLFRKNGETVDQAKKRLQNKN